MNPRCKKLILDAGPLLALSPLRGLADSFITVPEVLEELKDKRAQEHLQRLGLQFGIKIEVQSPSAASLTTIISWAKKTGDYAVLSHPDLCVLALTHQLSEEASQHQSTTVEAAPSESIDNATISNFDQLKLSDSKDTPEEVDKPSSEFSHESAHEPTSSSPIPLYDDPSDSDDGEGEWITPANVSIHKSKALDLLPSEDSEKRKGKAKDEMVAVGCMTADFAMQNVLLHMGLNLISTEGKRIEKIKTWVLRCHACFKICKDASKKFCPSCGNPSLLRASVTIASPNASSNAPIMQIHLKPNFQYKTRGTVYSIPAPKAGSAKTGAGEGLILREDQLEYMRAKKRVDGKRERDESKLMKGVLKQKDSGSVAIGSWMDPDFIPEIMTASTGGKGRTVRKGGMDGDMPRIGYGRKNPNEKRRK